MDILRLSFSFHKRSIRTNTRLCWWDKVARRSDHNLLIVKDYNIKVSFEFALHVKTPAFGCSHSDHGPRRCVICAHFLRAHRA